MDFIKSRASHHIGRSRTSRGRLLACLSALMFVALLVGCSAQPDEPAPRRPQQAGQPLDPLETAARITAIRGAALLGDQQAVQANMSAINEDFRKSMKLADPARRVDRESARAALRQLSGVLTSVWVDREAAGHGG